MDNSLPVVQAKESHALRLDPNQALAAGSYTLAVAPHPGIAVGAQVTLTWQGWSDENETDDPWKSVQTVQAAGQVLLYALEANYVGFIDGGFAQVSYRVAGVESPVQRLDIVPPSSTRLPAIGVVDHSGDSLDPEDFPEGLVLEIPGWPGIALHDDVLLYAASTVPGQNMVKALRVDQPALDAGKLVFTLEPAWLQRQLNETITLDWQYARPGAAGSSLSLSLQVLAAWRPVAPVIVGALPEDDEGAAPNQGYIAAMALRGGAVVQIPIELGGNDKVQVHWQGFGSTGQYIAEQACPDDPRRFSIPSTAVPANMGKRLDVFYTITRPGELQATSKVYDLRVVPLSGSNFTTVQCAHVDGDQLRLSQVPQEGALLTLRIWTFMAPGQLVTITADSASDENVLQDFPVTAAHVTARQLTTYVSHSYLASLAVGARLTLKVWVSFDEGHSRIEFPDLRLFIAI